MTRVSLAHSRGIGSYTGADAGTVESTMTGLYPWIGYRGKRAGHAVDGRRVRGQATCFSHPGGARAARPD